ncbi:MAG: DsbA family protein [Cystobacterineae bacterium]|nr:DsbA family protein [Cystobacterineae bacterium]
MSKYFYVAFASLVFILGLSACTPPASKGTAPKSTERTAAERADMVVAVFNDKTLTLEDVDLELGLYNLRKNVAMNMAFETILNEKAKQEEMPARVFMNKEIQARTEPPTEAAILAMYEENRSRMPPEMTFEKARGQIEGFLRNQSSQKVAQEIQKAWLDEAGFKFMLTEEGIEAIGPSVGPHNAKVTIVEFSDFECPFCRKGAETIAEVVKAYPTEVKLYFRNFPLKFHAKAPKAAEAALCAHDQGKFWEYHDLLFENQSKLDIEDLKEHAKTLALEALKFAECLDSGRHAETVKKDMRAGKRAGVEGTPAFFINGVLLSGAQPIENFKEIIEQALKAQ